MADQDGNHEIAETLTCCSIHHHLAATPSFDVGYADQTEQKIRDGVASGKETSLAISEPDGFNQDSRQVVCEASACTDSTN